MRYSYSALKDFDQCPSMYHEKRILKSVRFTGSVATEWGTKVHKAFEDFIESNEPLPPELFKHRDLLVELSNIPGTKFCELEMALDGNGNAVDYGDRVNALMIGIADLLVVHPDFTTGYYADYKTGKGRYPDTDQCHLMATMAFALFPHLLEIRAMLLFVEANKVVDTVYHRKDLDSMFKFWLAKIARVERAKAEDVWQLKPSALCPWCPVTFCPEWREDKKK